MINITVKNFQKRIRLTPSLLRNIRKIIRGCCRREHIIKKSGELTVCFVTDRKIRELNLRYSGENLPTDVIAFDISEQKNFILADIVVSIDAAFDNSGIYKTAPRDELYLYVIHGFLHILGYGDKNAKQRRIMQGKEKELIKTICRYTEPKH